MNNSVPVSINIIIVFCHPLSSLQCTALGSLVDVGPIVGGVTVVAVVLILAFTIIVAVIVVMRGKRTQKE